MPLTSAARTAGARLLPAAVGAMVPAMTQRPQPTRLDGRKVILGVLGTAVALTSAVVLTAWFSERTGMRNPTPVSAGPASR